MNIVNINAYKALVLEQDADKKNRNPQPMGQSKQQYFNDQKPLWWWERLLQVKVLLDNLATPSDLIRLRELVRKKTNIEKMKS